MKITNISIYCQENIIQYSVYCHLTNSFRLLRFLMKLRLVVWSSVIEYHVPSNLSSRYTNHRKKSVSKTLIVKYVPAVLRESRIFSCCQLPYLLSYLWYYIIFCTNTFLNLSIDHHIISCYTYPKWNKFQ